MKTIIRTLILCSYCITRVIEILYSFVLWIFANFKEKNSDSVAFLGGKTAIVTGGNSGIGFATATLLASRGCRVIIADKADSKKSTELIIERTGNKNVVSKYLDLSSLEEVRDFAASIKREEKKIDILVNNAGIGATEAPCTKDGLNCVMQVNYFGAFLLTHLLIDQLKSADKARIVFTASVLANTHHLRMKTLNPTDWGKNIFSLAMFYSNSKLCNILAAQGFAEKLRKYGIVANSIDPGVSLTPIYNYYGNEVFGSWILKASLDVLVFLFRTNEYVAAQSTFHVATSEKLTETSGLHFFRCRSFKKPWICDDKELCRAIWEKSEELVGLKEVEKIQ